MSNGNFIYAPNGGIDHPNAIDVDSVIRLFSVSGPGVTGPDIRLGKGDSGVRDTITAAVINRMREGGDVIISGEFRGAAAMRKTAFAYNYNSYVVGADFDKFIRIEEEDIDVLSTVELNFFDAYSKVIVVGDVQSCSAPLNRLVADYGRRDVMYVFCGDLFDRGPDAAGVLRTVRSLTHITVKGNHERNMEELLRGGQIRRNTQVSYDQIKSDHNLKNLHRELANTVPFLAFSFSGYEYWVTHGGVMGNAIEDIREVTDNGVEFHLGKIARSYFMFGSGAEIKNLKGIGDYELNEKVLGESMKGCSARVQFHGHRNERRIAADAVEGIGLLESGVDRGGVLTAAVIDRNGLSYVTY